MSNEATRLRGSVRFSHVSDVAYAAISLLFTTLFFQHFVAPFNVFMWKDLEGLLSVSLPHYFRILRQSLDFAVTPGDQPVSLCLLFALHVILRTFEQHPHLLVVSQVVAWAPLVRAWLSAHRPSSSPPLPACLVLLPLCPLGLLRFSPGPRSAVLGGFAWTLWYCQTRELTSVAIISLYLLLYLWLHT